MSESEGDYYALVYDAVEAALEHESLESVEDAVNTAIENWQADSDA